MIKSELNKYPITQWSTEDKPREKLVKLGQTALSDVELMAILIGNGLPGFSAVDVARALLQTFDNDLNKLYNAKLNDFKKVKGVGQAKAIKIMASLELGRRISNQAPTVLPQITCSKDAYLQFNNVLPNLDYEEFWILLLNRNNRVVEVKKISQGGISGTYVDRKLIFKYALEKNASSLVLGHNHPSGNLKPSSEDIVITKKIKEAGLILDIQILDHIILGNGDYFSFLDSNLI